MRGCRGATLAAPLPDEPDVIDKPGSVSPRTARGDHSSRRHIAVPLERSDPRAGARRHFGRAALDSAPIRACSGRGLPRRRSPGCRAWALTPRFHPCLCLRAVRLSRPAPHRPSAVCFLLRSPSGHPGSPLAISLPCGARTFLPRTVSVRRRSSDHLRQGGTLTDPGGYGAASGPVRHRQVTGRQRVECPFASESSIR